MRYETLSRRILPMLAATGLLQLAAAAQVVVRTHDGVRTGQRTGVALASADVDADGVEDILIGGTDERNQARGTVTAYSGRTGGGLFRVAGDRPGSRLGSVLAAVGDVDGDRHEDFIMASPEDSRGGRSAGAAAVISGRTGAVIRRHVGNSNNELGASATGLGDVDRDGRPDYAIGAPGGSVLFPRSYVSVFSGATGRLLQTVIADSAGDRFGAAVARVPDINGDQRDELAISAPLANTPRGRFAGSVAVFAVVPGAPSSRLSWHQGRFPGAELGRVMTSPGDVNGDGVADLLASNPDGRRIVGYVDVLSLASGGGLIRSHFVPGTRAQFGAALAGVGDYDRDGTPDYAVGAPFDIGLGFVTVYSGASARAISTTRGASVGDGYGHAVTSSGDVDRDGIGELAIGSPEASFRSAGSGRTVLLRRSFSTGFERFGQHCRNGASVVMGHNGQLPFVGRTTVIRTFGLQPRGVAFYVLGTSRTRFVGGPLPFDLSAFGMTGCRAYVSRSAVVPRSVDANGMTSLSLAFPNPAMAGRTVYAQVLATDDQNAAGLISTGAVGLTVGS